MSSKSLMVSIIAGFLGNTAAAVGPVSEYYLCTAEHTTLAKVQGPNVLFSVTSVDFDSPIAVQSTIRTTGAWEITGGGEYDLNGAYLGTPYTRGTDGLQTILDGTTDGTLNYGVSYETGGVSSWSTDWTTPALLFSTGRTNDSGGITYDPTNNTLWIAGFGTDVIEHYTLTGVLLGSFATGLAGTDGIASLALDHADGTLWFNVQNNSQNTFHQFSKAGGFISSVTYASLAGLNLLGGEFAFEENTCPWDCGDGDGFVGIVDFLALLGDWSVVGSPCDFDGGGVGIVDFLKLLANWGVCSTNDGACCDSTSGICTIETAVDCLALGRSYGGDGTDCIDNDEDRVPDDFELNDCGGPTPAGCFTLTDPFDPDTDNDGILDGDESWGTLGGLDLPGMGVDACHKDLLVETDWVHTSVQPANRNKLHINQVNRLVTAFANSDRANPDGVNGIKLHIDYGQAPYGGGNSLQDPANNTMVDLDSFAFNSGEYFDIKLVHFAANRHAYFHYTLMCDAYSVGGVYKDSSGLAELPGDDFIVSFGQWATGDSNRIGNTVMHELGHNLDLRHGGFEDRNFKPNYNSVMNYWYQVCGADSDDDVDPDDVTDYSYGLNINLNEDNLVEPDGVTGVGPGIDWNGDFDTVDTLARNINCRPTDTYTISSCNNVTRQPSLCNFAGACDDSSCDLLQDSDDWADLGLIFLLDSDFGPREVIHCMVHTPVVIVHRENRQQ